MRILIFGQPSNNRGDEAAAKGMIYGIRSKIKDAVFHIVYSTQHLEPVMDDNDYVTNHHKRYLTRFSKKIALKHLFYLMLYKLGIKTSSDSDPAFLSRLIIQSDAVAYSPAGPYIGDQCNTNRSIFFIALIKMYKKKIMIYAPSMGPFTKKNRSILKYIADRIRNHVLEKVDVITLRDGKSYDYVKSLNLSNKNIFLALDCALQNPISTDNNASLIKECLIDPNKKVLIGITPIDLSWHTRWSKIEGLNEKITLLTAQVLDHCVKTYDAQIVFFPQLFGSTRRPYSCDLPVIYNIIHHMKSKSSVRIVDPYFTTDQQQVLMAKMSFFIGFRHHSAVLAAKMLIPCICVSYEHKAISFMEDIQLDKYAIAIEDLSYSGLVSMIETIMADSADIKTHLKKISNDIRDKALLSSQKFYEMTAGKL